jgi:hypothetical protein
MSYHGTPVVVIEIPQGTPRPAAGDSLNLQTATGQRRDINSLLFLPLPFDPYDFFWLYRLWTRPRGVGATDLRLTNCLPTGVGESRKGEAILYS